MSVIMIAADGVQLDTSCANPEHVYPLHEAIAALRSMQDSLRAFRRRKTSGTASGCAAEVQEFVQLVHTAERHIAAAISALDANAALLGDAASLLATMKHWQQIQDPDQRKRAADAYMSRLEQTQRRVFHTLAEALIAQLTIEIAAFLFEIQSMNHH